MTDKATVRVGQFGRPALSMDGHTITVHIPIKLRRQGGRKQVETPAGATPWIPLGGHLGRNCSDFSRNASSCEKRYTNRSESPRDTQSRGQGKIVRCCIEETRVRIEAPRRSRRVSSCWRPLRAAGPPSEWFRSRRQKRPCTDRVAIQAPVA
jgi:hypothetical protein